MELIERAGTIAVLNGLLLSAVAGKGSVAVVTGPVGTGRTTLLTAFAERSMELGGLAITAAGCRSEQDLPLGVMGQLLMNAPLVDTERQRAMSFLREGIRKLTPEAGEVRQLGPQLVHSLCTFLLELAQRYPLAVVVDDMDHVDDASLVCLSYLARRVRFTSMLAVFSHASPRHPDALLPEDEELSRPPYGVHIPLTTLSTDGVREMIATTLSEAEADRLAARWFRLSGGSPLLLGGLLEDARTADGAAVRDGDPVDGGHYIEAVLTCLRRADSHLHHVAQAIAVQDGWDSLDKLTHLDSTWISHAVRALTAAGLLHEGNLPHPVVREAILSGIDAEERVALHLLAAEIKYHAGAPSQEVADQLLRAGTAHQPWAVTVLEDAARQTLRDGDVTTAVEHLKLAWTACDDDQRRAAIMTTMLRADWRINPSMSTSYLPELTAALRNGSLRGGDVLVLTKALLWNGQFTEALTALRQVTATGDHQDSPTLVELAILRRLLRTTFPGVSTPSFPPTPRTAGMMLKVADGHRLDATAALEAVLTHGPSPALIATAQRVLHHCGLEEMSLDTVDSALLVLTYAGRPDLAAPWCDRLVEEARVRQAPSRRARLAAIRAEISVRRGEMSAAVRYARLALETMPPSSWGVAIGGPLAALITAATVTGEHDLVREHLDLRITEEMFETRFGLHYLQARGRYGLAIGQLPHALRDFEVCGELAARWQLDLPGLIPWRVDAAEALLRMGYGDEAGKLADEQVTRCGKDHPRVLGMALRLLAAVADPPRRLELLKQAAELLTGDDYELARALTDLAETYRDTGGSRRVGMTAQRARMLATRTGARLLPRTGHFELERGDAEPVGSPGADSGSAVLSEAEMRVAGLAARGYTNREIAAKLFITGSTVEQHLTHAYRKLNVTRRTDLPMHLGLDTDDPAAPPKDPALRKSYRSIP